MDTTVRNLDEKAYRALKAQAASEGKTIGQAMTEAIFAYVGRPHETNAPPSFWAIEPWDFGPGTEHLSETLDEDAIGDPQ